MTSFYLFELYSEVYNLFISSSNYVIYCSQPSVNKKSFCLASIIVQSLSRVWFFATPWTAGRQAYLSFTISQNLLKLMSVEWVILSNHLILCCPLFLLPQSFPAWGSFPMRWLFTSGGQSTGASALASALSMNIQGLFPLGLTGSISLQSKGLLRVFSSITVRKHQLILQCSAFFMVQLSHPYMTTEKPQLSLDGLLSAKCRFCFLIHCLGLS